MRRVLDALVATLGLLILSPLLIAVALAVRLTSRGPALFKGRRVGLGATEFDIYKFRTMFAGSDRGAAITVANDKRVTPLGRLLRKYKIDELPQLLNVVKGDMALVGPRPESPAYVALYDDQARQILTYKPGLTSPASLTFRSEEELLTGADWEALYLQEILPRKVALDLAYMSRRSVSSDMVLVVKTMTTLLRRSEPRVGR